MQGSSDNSFIPKRGPTRRKNVGGTRQIYIFTYISYVLMFATLLASGGVYLYAQYIDGQLDSQIQALNSEIGSFSQSDMDRVTQFDLRLRQAQNRLQNSVSVVSVFEALEDATIDTVQIESLSIEREADDKFIVDATIQTDSFDSTIFQRGVYLRDETISTVAISEVQNVLGAEGESPLQTTSLTPVITFMALLEIPLSEVPPVPQAEAPVVSPADDVSDETDAAPTADALLDEEVSNEDDNDTSL